MVLTIYIWVSGIALIILWGYIFNRIIKALKRLKAVSGKEWSWFYNPLAVFGLQKLRSENPEFPEEFRKYKSISLRMFVLWFISLFLMFFFGVVIGVWTHL